MNLTLKALFSALLLAGTLAVQAQERIFVAVEYMRVPDSSSEKDYLDLEKLWLRIHQKSVDEGRCLGWYLSRLENDSRNHFVIVRAYNEAAKVFDPWTAPLPQLIKDLYTAEEAAKMEKTEQVRLLTRCELWEVEASVLTRMTEPAGFVQVDFNKVAPGKLDAYYVGEKEGWRKAHQIRAEAGDLKFWLFCGRWFPSGYDAEFDFVTLNGFADKAASEKPWDEAKLKAEFTEEQIKQGLAILDYRTVVRREFWRPVMQTKPARR